MYEFVHVRVHVRVCARVFVHACVCTYLLHVCV